MYKGIAAKRDQRGEECEAVPASESFWCTGFAVIRSALRSRDPEFREVHARLRMARRQLPASGNPPLKEQSSPSDGSPPQRYDRPLAFDVIELLRSSEVVSGNRDVGMVCVEVCSRASAGIDVFDMNPGTDPGGERKENVKVGTRRFKEMCGEERSERVGVVERRSRGERGTLHRSIALSTKQRAVDRTESATWELEIRSLSNSKLHSHGFVEARRYGTGYWIPRSRNHCLIRKPKSLETRLFSSSKAAISNYDLRIESRRIESQLSLN